jgi:hypothetical protein
MEIDKETHVYLGNNRWVPKELLDRWMSEYALANDLYIPTPEAPKEDVTLPPEQFAEALKGKTIAEVKHHSYMNWPFCIDTLVFTDGTSLELSGNADNAHAREISNPSGPSIFVQGSPW